MIAISLQSGSSGNCTYVEAGGVKLLFDAGLPGRETGARLTRYGFDIRAVEALVISHDHADHARCAGVLHRMYGIPLCATRGTLKESSRCIGRLTRALSTSGRGAAASTGRASTTVRAGFALAPV